MVLEFCERSVHAMGTGSANPQITVMIVEFIFWHVHV
jgi:hypothetical protein